MLWTSGKCTHPIYHSKLPSVVAAPSRRASNPLPELCNNILNRPSDQFRSFTFSVFQIILPMGGALSTAIMIFHYKLIALNSLDMPPRISTIGSCLVNRQREMIKIIVIVAVWSKSFSRCAFTVLGQQFHIETEDRDRKVTLINVYLSIKYATNRHILCNPLAIVSWSISTMGTRISHLFIGEKNFWDRPSSPPRIEFTYSHAAKRPWLTDVTYYNSCSLPSATTTECLFCRQQLPR